MSDETLGEHLARKPIDDSFVEVHMAGMLYGPTGAVLEEGRGNVTLEETPVGLRFTDRDSSVTRVIMWNAPPYSAVTKYVIHHATPGYIERLIDWMKDCDHAWLTHPSGPTTYCQHCRLDMNELGQLESGELKTLPTMVLENEVIDDQSRSFENIDQQPGSVHKLMVVEGEGGTMCGASHPREGMVTCTFPAGHGPIGPDEGSDIVMQHGAPERGMFWDVDDSGQGF